MTLTNNRYDHGETNPICVPADDAATIEIGEMVYLDASGNVLPISDADAAGTALWSGSTADTQEYVAARFLGVSSQRWPGGHTADDDVSRVARSGVFSFSCASATFKVGDMVGPAKASGNVLETGKVVAVTAAERSIGRVYRAGTSITTVLVEIRSNVFEGSALGTPGYIGAVAGTGVAVTEAGNSVYHRTTFTLTDVEVTLADEAGVVAHGGLKIYDFPEGLINILGASANLTIEAGTGINADADGDFSIGTVTASNNATLATTEQNILPTTATPQLVASAGTAKGVSTAVSVIDGTSTAIDAYLNFLIDDADQDGGGVITCNGTITIAWVYMGDK